jgi:hypothetical protein
VPECLDRQALPVLGGRHDLGERHTPLAASSVNSDFDHLMTSEMASFKPQSKNYRK